VLQLLISEKKSPRLIKIEHAGTVIVTSRTVCSEIAIIEELVLKKTVLGAVGWRYLYTVAVSIKDGTWTIQLCRNRAVLGTKVRLIWWSRF
jgi:hypothetical protein